MIKILRLIFRHSSKNSLKIQRNIEQLISYISGTAKIPANMLKEVENIAPARRRVNQLATLISPLLVTFLL